MVEKRDIKELLEFCIINLDKPAGPTSFSAINAVRKIIGAKKAGHFGTLDPMVTGVLPIALNRACKLSNYFMKKDKEYVGEMHVHKEIGKEKLEDEMNKFIGKIIQKPPVKSRVKRVERERTINKFKIVKIRKSAKKKGVIVEFHSDVQAGTYIRKLISDLGERIGGAHMIKLRRVRAGIFKEADSFTIEKIREAFEEYKKGREDKLRKILIPAEIIKQMITSVQIKPEIVEGLLNGKPIMNDDVKSVPNSELFSVFSGERFIGIYKRVDEEEIIARAEFVKN